MHVETAQAVALANANTPRSAHSCNCVGCCKDCGTCRTWHGHTREYCALVQRQRTEREQQLAKIERAKTARAETQKRRAGKSVSFASMSHPLIHVPPRMELRRP